MRTRSCTDTSEDQEEPSKGRFYNCPAGWTCELDNSEMLKSYGFDLFQYLAGDIIEVSGFTARQAGRYAAEDAVTACWTFSSGALGMGCWNFVADRREDRVELIGSRGRICFSVFEDQPRPTAFPTKSWCSLSMLTCNSSTWITPPPSNAATSSH